MHQHLLLIRQPPTLPCRLQHSTLGRLGLNHRVRDENGCVPQTHRHRKYLFGCISSVFRLDSVDCKPLSHSHPRNQLRFAHDPALPFANTPCFAHGLPVSHTHAPFCSAKWWECYSVSDCVLCSLRNCCFPTLNSQQPNSNPTPTSSFLRKEVIQPHLPIRLPCYDFTPVTKPAFGGLLLSVGAPTSGISGSHGVTGGVYKTRERIHRDILIRDY